MWEPQISRETNAGVTTVNLRSSLLGERKIYIDDEIDSNFANSFMLEYQYLVKENEYPIDIYINSPGGEINAGLMMYDIITNSEVEMNLYCTGIAASMAAILFACGKIGHRFILPNSKVMIHEPLIANGVGGSATTIQNTAKNILKVKQKTCEILAKHTGKSIAEIEKAIEHDNYMGAEEAIKFGICDKIVLKI